MLEIEDLKTNFNTYDGVVKALDGVNLKIKDGEIFGLVGETGSGKSVTCYSALKLLPKTGEVVGGNVKLNGENITDASDARLREIRGGEIGIIFQDPLSALNPVMTVNEQIGEILILHQDKETFGYYYVSNFSSDEDQNIWVHYIEERKGWDTRIKLSESDVNKIMTTDEFKDLVESQDYETNNSVLVIGDILKDMDIPFTFDQVILD